MSEALRSVRLVSIGAFGAWLLLVALAYQQIAYFKYAWAANLLQYLPAWFGWLLALIALIVTTEEARRGAIRVARMIAALYARLPRPVMEVLLLCALAALLWLLRERHAFAHGDRMLLILASPEAGLLPGGGGAWILKGIAGLGAALGVAPLPTIFAVNSVCGAAAIVLVARAANALGHAGTSVIPLLVFSAGLVRAVGARIDPEPIFLCAAACCLLLALENLRGRGRLSFTALAFGATAALDPLGRFLLPGLVALAWTASSAQTEGGGARAIARALAIALVPLALHGALLLASTGTSTDSIVAALFGRGEAGWVRGFGHAWRSNTAYALLSQPHLKYLGNSLLLLAPAALPLLLGFAVARRGRIAETPALRFLAITSLSLVVGSFVIRPTAGPFDWDMLGVTALFLAFFAGSLVVEMRTDRLRMQLVAAVVGLQLLFFGAPLSAIAFGAANRDGPFAERSYKGWNPQSPGRAPASVARWL